MRILSALVLAIVLVLGVGASEASQKLKASNLRFDGFKLGQSYAQVMKRPPYAAPCDNDPIDKKKRRFMVYGALACRNRTFPQQTTVMFYLRHSKTARYDQPILAFAYLHGSYFNKKTNFPLKPGEPLSKAKRYFNKPAKTFTIARKRLRLTVHAYPAGIHILAKGTTIVGFVFGEMPSDANNEQWRGLMQMYQRYTPK